MSDTVWPDLAGRLTDDGGHQLQVRVYYENTDFSGLVYHADYLKFMERGRSDYLRLLGIHHTELADGAHGAATHFAIRHMEIDFLKPARIDDVLTVTTRSTKARGARFWLHQTVRRGGEALIEADLTAVVIDGNGRPKRLPAALLSAFGV